MVKDILMNPDIDGLAKIKVFTIFALRYEGDTNLSDFESILKDSGISQDHIRFKDYILQYAGKDKRSPLLFKKTRDILSKGINFLRSNFEDVQNVFTQHKSLLYSILDQLLQKKLSESDFPYVQGQVYDVPENVVVFIVGGATFEEAWEVHQFNEKSQTNIMLGGTIIHNSKSFIAECADIATI